MSNFLPFPQAAEAPRIQRWALLVGGIALLICLIGAPFSPAQFFRAYLAAYQLYLGIPLGCLVILMIYHLTGGAWGFLIQRILEAGMRTLPLLALLFIPIPCGMGYLYLWAQPAEIATHKDIQHKQIYLNPTFFCIRAALFFALWITIAFLLNYWSNRQEQTGDQRLARWQAKLSGPGLVVFGISITFASVDWLMSLQTDFHSTIYGPLIASGQILTGQAVAIIVLAWIAPRPPVANIVSVEALNDLGNLLFTYLVVWSYMVWFQFMLIWIANLPYEVIWYLPRSRDGWQWVAYALFVLHFAVPFFLLLMRDVKRDLPTLAKVAALLLFMHLVYMYYLVMPVFHGTTLAQHWMDFLTPLGLGGLWLAYFVRELQQRPLLPGPSGNQAEAAHLRELDEEQAARMREIQHHG